MSVCNIVFEYINSWILTDQMDNCIGSGLLINGNRNHNNKQIITTLTSYPLPSNAHEIVQ